LSLNAKKSTKNIAKKGIWCSIIKCFLWSLTIEVEDLA